MSTVLGFLDFGTLIINRPAPCRHPHLPLLARKEIAALYDATRDETDKATVKANLARIARLKGEL